MLPKNELNFSNEASTLFHKKFYSKVNSNWAEFINIYEKFIFDEVSKIIPGLSCINICLPMSSSSK